MCNFVQVQINGVGYKIVDGVLLSWCPELNMPRLHEKPLIEITEEEWRKDNVPYAPSDIE